MPGWELSHRASERRFYQKITDIYATAVDYSFDSQTTKDFFATVQNKTHLADRPVYLKLRIRDSRVQFFFGYREDELEKTGPEVNASFLSDEACEEGWFTGTMIGICCQDLTGFGKYADFDWFEVRAKAGDERA